MRVRFMAVLVEYFVTLHSGSKEETRSCNTSQTSSIKYMMLMIMMITLAIKLCGSTLLYQSSKLHCSVIQLSVFLEPQAIPYFLKTHFSRSFPSSCKTSDLPVDRFPNKFPTNLCGIPNPDIQYIIVIFFRINAFYYNFLIVVEFINFYAFFA